MIKNKSRKIRKNMQHNKSINNISEIGVFAKDSDTLTSTLCEVIGKFKFEKSSCPFRCPKKQGTGNFEHCKYFNIVAFLWYIKYLRVY